MTTTAEWKRDPETGVYTLKTGSAGKFKVTKEMTPKGGGVVKPTGKWILTRKRKGKAKRVVGEFPTLTAAKAEVMVILSGVDRALSKAAEAL